MSFLNDLHPKSNFLGIRAHDAPHRPYPPRHRIAILVLVDGGTMREAGKRCGLGDSAAMSLKRRIAADLIEFFGEDVIRRLLDGTRPGWESDLRMSRERHLCLVEAGQDVARPETR